VSNCRAKSAYENGDIEEAAELVAVGRLIMEEGRS